MPLRNKPGFMLENSEQKENLICVNIGNKLQYISIVEAGALVHSIVSQLEIIGLGNGSQTDTGKHKKDISRKTGCGD